MAVWTLETSTDFTQFNFALKEDKIFFQGLVKNYFDEAKPLLESWRVLYLVRGEPKKHPDFFEIDESDVIAISQKAARFLDNYLNDRIELLPIETDAGKYYAINVLNFVDCLNKRVSDYVATQTGTIVNYSLLEFDEKQMGDNVIFKIPELPYRIFISDDIQALCEEENLQGLVFDEESNLVWYPE